MVDTARCDLLGSLEVWLSDAAPDFLERVDSGLLDYLADWPLTRRVEEHLGWLPGMEDWPA